MKTTTTNSNPATTPAKRGSVGRKRLWHQGVDTTRSGLGKTLLRSCGRETAGLQSARLAAVAAAAAPGGRSGGKCAPRLSTQLPDALREAAAQRGGGGDFVLPQEGLFLEQRQSLKPYVPILRSWDWHWKRPPASSGVRSWRSAACTECGWDLLQGRGVERGVEKSRGW